MNQRQPLSAAQSTEPQTKTQLTYWDHKYLMMNKELIQVRPSLTPELPMTDKKQ